MLEIQKFLQEVPVEEAVRRGVRVALPPRAHGRTVLGVRRVRDLGHDLAQVPFERGQVERELGSRFDDDADAPGGCEEEQFGHEGYCVVVVAAGRWIARGHGT